MLTVLMLLYWLTHEYKVLFQYSIGDAAVRRVPGRAALGVSFNTPLEMQSSMRSIP